MPSATERSERRIIEMMLAVLAAEGFTPTEVCDGEEMVPATTNAAVMDAVFSVGVSRVYFAHPSVPAGSVVLVGGNGEDVISDWSYSDDDDTFNATMHRVLDRVEDVA